MPSKGGKGGKGRGHSSSETFSGQKKKAQLQSKREKRRQKHDSDSEAGSDEDHEKHEIQKHKPVVITSFGGNCTTEDARLSSMFAREDDESIATRRALGAEPLVPKENLVAESFAPHRAGCSASIDSAAESTQGSKLPHPIRPRWSERMSTAMLAKQEEDYFKLWCDNISSRIEAVGSEGVAPFELNLEVWRQLWRVIEQSDVVVLIVDVRNPTFHIPPSLVYDVVVTQCRRMVIVLSKCDLVSHAFVQRWRVYLSSKLPDVEVVEFVSRPVEDPPGGERGAGSISSRRRWLARRCRQSDIDSHLKRLAEVIMRSILRTKHTDSTGEEISSKQESENRGLSPAAREDDDSSETDESDAEEAIQSGEVVVNDVRRRSSEFKDDGDCTIVGRGPNGALSIGLVGHPNVGKTSVLNALAGRKAASVSGTAGHTKHLQHIRVDETVHSDAYVIDCPGLVFPSLNSRAEAELNGLLPLAQVRETMSAVRVIAEAISLPKALALKMPEWYDDDSPWTPQTILEAHAEKNRYYLPRSGAPDMHRAGLEILKDAKDGAILLAYEPPAS